MSSGIDDAVFDELVRHLDLLADHLGRPVLLVGDGEETVIYPRGTRAADPCILDRHATDSHHYHQCGGTILTGPDTDDGTMYYCDRCGAFRHGEGPIPSGTNPAANQAALDAGDLMSPEARL